MRIGVALRLVADAGGDHGAAERGNDVDREWIDLKLVQFDDQALEETLALKQDAGAILVGLEAGERLGKGRET